MSDTDLPDDSILDERLLDEMKRAGLFEAMDNADREMAKLVSQLPGWKAGMSTPAFVVPLLMRVYGLSPKEIAGLDVYQMRMLLSDAIRSTPGNASKPVEQSENDSTWISLADAEKLSSIHRGTISKDVAKGKIKSNGKTGKGKLKIDSADFNRWHLERVKRAEQIESNEQVEKQIEKTTRNTKRNNR